MAETLMKAYGEIAMEADVVTKGLGQLLGVDEKPGELGIS